MKQARSAYYNLPRLGVTGYRCEVVTDWRSILANLAGPEALKNGRGLQVLESVHLWMTVDKSGDPKFTERIDLASDDTTGREWVAKLLPKQKASLATTAHDLRRHLIVGFLPEPNENFTLEEKDGRYVISIADGNSHATLWMGRDFKAIEFTMKLPEGTVTINPEYIETPQGFLRTRRIETHTNPHDSGTDSEVLEYSDVGGVKIPTKITSVVTLDRAPDNGPRQMIFEFKSCELQKAN